MKTADNSTGARGIRLRVLWGLATRDLRHERLLTACLVVALAGVVAPLLVLFGLKSGVMETLRSNLVNDPVYREIRPEETRLYSPDFFQHVEQLDQTQFVIGNVSKGASVIRVDIAGNEDGQFADMLPSGAGDPLLIEYGVTPPGEAEVVMSFPLATALQVETGDTLTLSSSRTDDGNRRQASAEMTLTGILPERADVIDRVYVPLQFAVDVESFREGFAIEKRGWEGGGQDVTPVYQGVVVALNRKMSSTDQQRAINNTGFFLIDTLQEEEFAERFQLELPDHVALYDIKVIDEPASAASVERLQARLSGTLVAHYAYVEPLPLELQLPDGSWQSFQVSGDPALQREQLVLPATLHEHYASGNKIQLRVESVDGKMPFDGVLFASHASDRVLVSQERAGILLNARNKAMHYDDSTSRFRARPSGYRGFRLFARNINDVEALAAELQAMGIASLSSVREILRLQALDKGLTSLFSVIAALGLGTGAIVFLASQYGAVQRKRAALAHLRLMGLARRHVAMIPLIQGACIAMMGAVLGVMITYGISAVINRWFAQPLGFEGQVSIIRPITLVVATIVLLVLSLIASTGASLSATRIDPADGMRDE